MVANPMQKIKRNSILTGLIIGLVVGLIMCVILYMFLTKFGTTSKTISGKEGTATVCVLNKAVKSGNKISSSDVLTKSVNKEDAPEDATTSVLNSIAKIDLSAGTILTPSMLNQSSEKITSDLREQEYNMITLPSKLSKGDFIDIRLQLPNGGDYIVISRKEVLKCDSSTIWLNMYEEELEIMSNAIIEYYIMTGSKLYATTYIEPGTQTALVATYVPNSTVIKLINSNPNITNLINSDRYSEELRQIRENNINSSLSQYKENATENIEQNIKKEIETLKSSREAYFGALDSSN